MDPVLVVRQPGGSVRAFLNQCRHRGNTRSFMFSFRGGNYGLDGTAINILHGTDICDTNGPAVFRAPHRCAWPTTNRFIFGNWDQTAPSFEACPG